MDVYYTLKEKYLFLNTRPSRNTDVKIIFLVELHVRHKNINWFLAEKKILNIESVGFQLIY